MTSFLSDQLFDQSFPTLFLSCVVKLLEGIIADWLYFTAETKNPFSHLQASFFKSNPMHCQSLRGWVSATPYATLSSDATGLQQGIWHCFAREAPPCMLDAGIPITFNICWLRSFVTDCKALLKIRNVFSSSCRFNKALPQGSILVL